jgi:sugar lactone lactonase YvrE
MPSHSPNATAADAQRNIYVADRGNRRIQVFDDDGKFLRQITIDVPLDYPYLTRWRLEAPCLYMAVASRLSSSEG